jgi:hypothetical protein
MTDKNQNRLYCLADLDKAYSLGLETAVYVLEQTITLPVEDRASLIKTLKREILNDKVASLRSPK